MDVHVRPQTPDQEQSAGVPTANDRYYTVLMVSGLLYLLSNDDDTSLRHRKYNSQVLLSFGAKVARIMVLEVDGRGSGHAIASGVRLGDDLGCV